MSSNSENNSNDSLRDMILLLNIVGFGTVGMMFIIGFIMTN